MTNKIIAIQGNHPSKLNPRSDTSVFLAHEIPRGEISKNWTADDASKPRGTCKVLQQTEPCSSCDKMP